MMAIDAMAVNTFCTIVAGLALTSSSGSACRRWSSSTALGSGYVMAVSARSWRTTGEQTVRFRGGRSTDRPAGSEIFMHIVMVVIFGLVSLGVFVAAARLVGRDVADGAHVFLWVWLAASIVNGAVGVFHAG